MASERVTFREWWRRFWRGAQREYPAPDKPLPFDADRVAELMERGDPKDSEEIGRRLTGMGG